MSSFPKNLNLSKTPSLSHSRYSFFNLDFHFVSDVKPLAPATSTIKILELHCSFMKDRYEVKGVLFEILKYLAIDGKML